MKSNEKKGSGIGIASLILGIIAICTSFIPIVNNASFFMGALAAIFGIIGLVKREKKGKAIAGLILGILSVIITLALQSSWSKAIDDFSNDLDNLTGDNTEEILENNVDIKLGDFVVTTDEFGLNDTKLTVTVTNKSSEKRSFSISIEAVDQDGNRIDDDTIYINDLNPGQSQSEKAFVFVEGDKIPSLKNAKFNINDVSMY